MLKTICNRQVVQKRFQTDKFNRNNLDDKIMHLNVTIKSSLFDEINY